jgi:predicted transcriptional regulator
MRTRFVGPIHLPSDLYKRLEQLAYANERDCLQQARWMLKQALSAAPPVDTTMDDEEEEASDASPDIPE